VDWLKEFMDLMLGIERVLVSYGYIGAFLISFLGNLTIFIPVPFAFFIIALGATLNPFLVGVACGLGSTLGKLLAYLVGWAGRKLIDERYGSRLESAKSLIRRYGAVMVFLFALLPLPDDLIMIPMGMLRYSFVNFLIATLMGKLVMGLILAYSGHFGFRIIHFLRETSGILTSLATVILFIFIVVVLLKIDWGRLLDRANKNDEDIGSIK
jgi:membrane protein DedA with SNARE-associated domain